MKWCIIVTPISSEKCLNLTESKYFSLQWYLKDDAQWLLYHLLKTPHLSHLYLSFWNSMTVFMPAAWTFLFRRNIMLKQSFAETLVPNLLFSCCKLSFQSLFYLKISCFSPSSINNCYKNSLYSCWYLNCNICTEIRKMGQAELRFTNCSVSAAVS